MSATSSIPRPGAVSPLTPKIVLMHGAGRLVDLGARDQAATRERLSGFAQSPLRCRASSATPHALSSYLATIAGPVVLVGHSHGGALITNVEPSPFDTGSLLNTREAHGLTISLERQRDTALTQVAVNDAQAASLVVFQCRGQERASLPASPQVRTLN